MVVLAVAVSSNCIHLHCHCSCHCVSRFMMLYRYTITNEHSMRVQVVTFGARVISVELPDRHGTTTDVILGCDNIAG